MAYVTQFWLPTTTSPVSDGTYIYTVHSYTWTREAIVQYSTTGTELGLYYDYTRTDSSNPTLTAALPWKLIAYTAIFDGKSFVLNT